MKHYIIIIIIIIQGKCKQCFILWCVFGTQLSLTFRCCFSQAGSSSKSRSHSSSCIMYSSGSYPLSYGTESSIWFIIYPLFSLIWWVTCDIRLLSLSFWWNWTLQYLGCLSLFRSCCFPVSRPQCASSDSNERSDCQLVLMGHMTRCPSTPLIIVPPAVTSSLTNVILTHKQPFQQMLVTPLKLLNSQHYIFNSHRIL